MHHASSMQTLQLTVALALSLLQDIAKNQTVQRLHDLKRDYTSFLYGFAALGPGEEPDDLSTNIPAVFENSDLATIFFR